MATSNDLSYQTRLTAAEVEFFAEETFVTIIPKFEADNIPLIGGDVGPFKASRPTQVPMWLAIMLKTRGKCSIKPPDWLSVDSLKELIENERSSPIYTKIPDHFKEISLLFLEHAIDDVESPSEIRLLLRDLEDVRDTKMRKGVAAIQDSVAVKLNNITHLEATAVRSFYTEAMNTFAKLP